MRDTSCPSRKYCPDVGRSRQPTMCMNVDLPDPDGPVTARNSPSWTSRLTPRSARTSTSPTTYVLTRFLTPMTTGIALPASPAAAATAEPTIAAAVALLREERIALTRRRLRLESIEQSGTPVAATITATPSADVAAAAAAPEAAIREAAALIAAATSTGSAAFGPATLSAILTLLRATAVLCRTALGRRI